MTYQTAFRRLSSSCVIAGVCLIGLTSCMAEGINVTVKMKNSSNDAFTLNAEPAEGWLSWGKFLKAPINTIEANQAESVVLFQASGRAWTTTGTEGHVDYTGPEGAEIRFKFEINWGLNENAFGVGCTPPPAQPHACSRYRIDHTGSIEHSPVTVEVTVAHP